MYSSTLIVNSGLDVKLWPAKCPATVALALCLMSSRWSIYGSVCSLANIFAYLGHSPKDAMESQFVYHHHHYHHHHHHSASSAYVSSLPGNMANRRDIISGKVMYLNVILMHVRY